MARADLDAHLSKIDELISEIEQLVPPGNFRADQFRADLAGLLVVAIAATYETCVKDILYDHANGHHTAFGKFALANYSKLNSRIRVKDLEGYCKLFDPNISTKFKNLMSRRKAKILLRAGKNIETSYELLLSWRHDFAHARIRNTTIEEAAVTHRFGKRVIYILDDALNGAQTT